MSSFAKRQMEKMGWKEGEGLGKNAAGVSTYIRVERRNPALQSGLGHEAGKGGSDSSDMGLDQLLASIASKKPTTSTETEPSATEDDALPSKKRVRESSVTSSSSSDDDDDQPSTTASGADMLKWKDEDLFKKCGGVRLGRGGRHRFFDGKHSRIEASNASLPPNK